MWYVHTEYTLRNATASQFFEDAPTYRRSQGILGYTLFYSEDSCLSLLNTSSYLYSFWPLYTRTHLRVLPAHEEGKNLLMK